MSEIFKELSPVALAMATKANMAELFARFKHARQTDFFANSSLFRWRTHIPVPPFYGVICTQPAQTGDETMVNDAIAYFQSHQVESFSWWIRPDVPATSWEPLLFAHGFKHDTSMPGMAIDLNLLADIATTPQGMTISLVNDAASVREWVHTFILGFGMPTDWEPDILDLIYGFGIDWPAQNYLARLDGVPVATLSVYYLAGVAGIYNVATVPEARRKGIGAAITTASLQDARMHGYRVGVLGASEMGYPVYRKLGFETVCQLDNYVWGANSSGH